MHTTDATLGSIVWGVPRNSFHMLSNLRRMIYCAWHAEKFRMFFLGILAGDQDMSLEDKLGYHEWLHDVEWAKLLANVHEKAGWKRRVDNVDDPIDACIGGVNGEYQRLFRCYKMGCHPYTNGVV